MRQLIQRLTDATGDTRCAPAAAGEIEKAEKSLGFRLPVSVREVYGRVGNGGFGPGYGLIGLLSGAPLDTGDFAVGLYDSFCRTDPDDPDWNWPRGLLPLCHWGCAIYSCVDCNRAEAPVIRFDPNGHGPGVSWDGAWKAEAESFESWLHKWIEGDLKFEMND